MDSEWAAVRPARVVQTASMRVGVTGIILFLATALVALSLRSAPPTVLYQGWNSVPNYMLASVTSPIGPACQPCMEQILNNNKPWDDDAYLDPERAMSCVVGNCKEASSSAMESAGRAFEQEQQLQARKDGTETQELADSEHQNAEKTSMEQFAYDEKDLDQEQLLLNWKRARTFAHYFGKPSSKKEDVVLTQWVAPLDPSGRPVPAWLTFQPTALDSAQIASAALTANTLQGEGSDNSIWTPPKFAAPTTSLASLTKTDSNEDASPARGCIEQTSCHGCTSSGCHWCGGGDICAAECPATFGAVTFTTLSQCDALTSTASSASNTQPHAPAAAAAASANGGAKGSHKSEAAAAGDPMQRKNAEALKELVQLSQHTSGNELVDSDVAIEYRLRAVDVRSKDDPHGPSLADALHPLNQEQTDINHRREMLYFRMETNIHPGEGGEEFDNSVKATTTWSLIGRPMTGWLHWGDDNDGGFLNPVGGSQWDPMVVNPAANKGTYGPAVNAYTARHPHPEDEEASMAGSPLFGT